MILTDHAVRRYVQRIAPALSSPDARAALASAAKRATLLPHRTYKGQQLWRVPDGVALVVKHDPALGLVVVTVLPPDAVEIAEVDDGDDDGIVAAFRRADPVAAALPSDPKPTRREVLRARLAEEAQQRDEKRARRLANMARDEAEHAAALARKAARIAAHEERGAIARAMKTEKSRENSAVYFASWAGAIPWR